MSKETTISCSPFGCAGVIVAALFFWGLVFGVTYNGKHHSVGCSCNDGVTVKTTEKRP